jgi:TolA-binding protein
MWPTTALSWVELGLAAFAVLGLLFGVGRSSYKGVIYTRFVNPYILEPRRKAKQAHERVNEVAERVETVHQDVEEVRDYQELQTDVLIAVGEAANNGSEFDVEEYRRVADRGNPSRFLDDHSERSDD